MRKSSTKKRKSPSRRNGSPRRKRYSRDQLKMMNVPQLQKLARKRCKSGVSKLTKKQLIRKLSPKKRHSKTVKKSSRKNKKSSSMSNGYSPSYSQSFLKKHFGNGTSQVDMYIEEDTYSHGYSPDKNKLCTRIENSKGWYLVKMKGCPYCTNAEQDLKTHKQKYQSVTVDKNNEADIYKCVDKQYTPGSIKGLNEKTYRFYPMIYKDGKFIGGYGELKDLIDKER